MHYRNKLYFIWSGWVNNNDGFPQHLFIAEMSSPTKISSKRVLIASPVNNWEKDGTPDRKGLLEGPEVLVSPKGKYFITYSGGASWTEFYKIGVLELRGDNPMNPSHWFHDPNPLFGESKETSVYGTGHASYVKSKDGKQDYIVYHAMAVPNGGWAGRTTRIQEFHWNPVSQYPEFGRPAPLSQVHPSPSGECPH
jgi:GH43 family beta-xylosidase